MLSGISITKIYLSLIGLGRDQLLIKKNSLPTDYGLYNVFNKQQKLENILHCLLIRKYTAKINLSIKVSEL